MVRFSQFPAETILLVKQIATAQAPMPQNWYWFPFEIF